MQILKDLFKTFLLPYERQMEDRYLSGAVDLADLEYRMKEIARGKFAPRPFTAGFYS